MRLRCPRCMTIVDARPGEPVACPSCGFSAAAPPAGAPATPQPPASSAPSYNAPGSYAPPPAMPAMAPPPLPTDVQASLLNPNHGPLGKRRWPGTPILLGLVTFGIYVIVWFWKVTNEMDAFMQRPGHSNRKVRLGVFLYIAAAIVMIIGFLAIASAGPAAFDETTPPEELPAAQLAIFALALLAGLALLIAAYVLIIMGLWRLWKMMEEEDQRRLVRDPFNATMALVLFVLVIVPYAGVILYMVSIGLTQKGLNRIWDAYRAPAVPPMPTMG